MPSVDIEKLAKVLGLLGSTVDGEVLAAARQATEILRRADATWADVLRLPATRPGAMFVQAGDAPIRFGRVELVPPVAGRWLDSALRLLRDDYAVLLEESERTWLRQLIARIGRRSIHPHEAYALWQKWRRVVPPAPAQAAG